MRLQNIFHNKKVITFGISGLILVFAYVLIRFIVFDTDPLIPLLSFIDNSWLLLAEKLANQLLHLFGSSFRIDNHLIFVENRQIGEIVTVTILKKWALLLFMLIWITKSPVRDRIFFTALVILVNYLLLTVELAFGVLDYDNYPIIALLRTIGVISMTSILFVWYRMNKEEILRGLTKLRIGTELLDKKFRVIVVLTYIYAIVGIFLLHYFNYHGWINFLFGSSQKILALLGYDAWVEPFLLVGNNGSIYMAKYCLGFKTMLLFASLVYLTGNDNKSRWIYIILGLVFLNFVNIMRFVFLFIHIQKHGDYVLAMDLHDMYNYITYSIVFILWVIWFEKYSDIKYIRNKLKSSIKEIN